MVKSKKNSKLHNAIYDSNFELVRALILKDPNSIHSRRHWLKEPIIHVACEKGNYDIVEFLIKNGADLDVNGHMNSSPLQYAASGGNAKIIDLLIKLGVDVNSVRDGGETPIFFASTEEAVNELIKNGADFNIRNWSYKTPLHFASQFGNSGAIKGLIINGADINAQDRVGKTPLHWVNNANTARVLLDLGADIDFLDYEGNSPLNDFLYSYKDQEIELIKVLLDFGANIEKKNKEGVAPYHKAKISRKEVRELFEIYIKEKKLVLFPPLNFDDAYKVKQEYIRVNPNNKNEIICVGESGFITKWEFNDSLKPVMVKDTGYPEVKDLSISEDNKLIAFAYTNNIEFLDYYSFEQVENIYLDLNLNPDGYIYPRLISFLNNNLLAMTNDYTTYIYDNKSKIIDYIKSQCKEDKYISYEQARIIEANKKLNLLAIGVEVRNRFGIAYIYKINKIGKYKFHSKIKLRDKCPDQLTFSPNDKIIAITLRDINYQDYGGAERCAIRIHEVNTGKKIKHISTPNLGAYNKKNIICFSKDSRFLFWPEYSELLGVSICIYNLENDILIRKNININKKVSTIAINDENHVLYATIHKDKIITINLNELL